MFSRKFILAAAALIALCSGAVAQFGPQISDVPCAFVDCKVKTLAVGGAPIGTDALGVTGSQTFTLSDALTSTVGYSTVYAHTTSGTAAAGFGTGFRYNLQNAAGTTRDAVDQEVSWTTATDTAEVAQIKWYLNSSGTAHTLAATLSAAGSFTAVGNLVGVNMIASGDLRAGANGSRISMRGSLLTTISSPADNSFQFGMADVDTAPVAQTLRTQGALAGGTSNVAGANWTFIASPGKGTGAGGSLIFQTAPAGLTGSTVNAPVTALTLDSTQKATFAGQINVTAMTQSSAAQSGTVCYNSGTGAVNYDATLGCLTSLEELKDIRPGGISGALPEIMKLRPFWYSWKHNTPEWKGGNHETLPGLGAHATEAVDKRLVGYGPTGKLAGVHYTEMVALLVAGLQEEHRDNLALKAANDNLERRIAKLERRR